MDVQLASQVEWATTQLKPKQTSPRLTTLLMQKITESLDTCTVDDLMYILQGFRQKSSREFFSLVRSKLMIRKE